MVTVWSVELATKILIAVKIQNTCRKNTIENTPEDPD
jgi:hypothetical protein